MKATLVRESDSRCRGLEWAPYGALKAGARGFLLKDADQELLVQAIKTAAAGDALVAPNITARLLEAFATTGRSAALPQPIDPLTEREEEVLAEVARGKTNAEIAEDPFISNSTVRRTSPD